MWCSPVPAPSTDTRTDPAEGIAPRHDQPDMPNLLCGAAAHGQQLGGRNRLTTLVIIITTHIGVTGLASYHRYRRIEHVHWITSKHWTESAYCHSFGSREMSELWLPRWHCPFLFWPRGGRKRRVGFWTWDCGWLMAINSISHLSSLPHYWVVAGLSWWVLPCCCEAGLLEEGARRTQQLHR